jgi:predicted phosphodiesterase
MEISLLSDVHLEKIEASLNKQCIPKRNLDIFSLIYTPKHVNICILAGDIGNPFSQYYWDFISYIAGMSDIVIAILGNHEYYNDQIFLEKSDHCNSHLSEKSDCCNSTLKPKTIAETNAKVLEMEKMYSNVYFLIDDILEVVFDDTLYTFIGTTLWSCIPDEYANEIMEKSPQFHSIPDFIGPDGLSNYNKCNQKAKQLLIDGCKMKNPWIITHFAPFFNVCQSEKYRTSFDDQILLSNIIHNSISQYGYSNALFYLNPLVWCYGHTHYDINDTHIFTFPRKKTSYLSNQCGSCVKLIEKDSKINHQNVLNKEKNDSDRNVYDPSLIVIAEMDYSRKLECPFKLKSKRRFALI